MLSKQSSNFYIIGILRSRSALRSNIHFDWEAVRIGQCQGCLRSFAFHKWLIIWLVCPPNSTVAVRILLDFDPRFVLSCLFNLIMSYGVEVGGPSGRVPWRSAGQACPAWLPNQNQIFQLNRWPSNWSVQSGFCLSGNGRLTGQNKQKTPFSANRFV